MKPFKLPLHSFVLRSILAATAGGLITLSLAPLKWWPSAILALFLLLLVLKNTPKKQGILISVIFSATLFTTGCSWVFHSIHTYGNASVFLASLLTALFCLTLTLCFLPFLVLWHRFFSHSTVGILLGFPACWVLGEWFRSWFLTGFPWLYVGYSHTESPLFAWAAVTGVFGLSWISAFTAAVIFDGYQQKKAKTLPLLALIIIWGAALPLQAINWTTPVAQVSSFSNANSTQSAPSTQVSVALVQGVIPQQLKWDKSYAETNKQRYLSLSKPYWGNQIILWPETAITEFPQQAEEYIESLTIKAQNNNTTLITGIPTLSRHNNSVTYHNSIMALGVGAGTYNKAKLVPFGEYLPLEKTLRGLIDFFDLPMSQFSAGSNQQPLLTAGDWLVSPSICYEIVYPSFVAQRAQSANFLVTISNDTWFGETLGPKQHLQMAQMRAIETGRYLLRGTNDGISAIINPDGKILEQSTRFKQEVIIGMIEPRRGLTLYMQWLNYPVLLLIFISLWLGLRQRHLKP